MVVVARRADPGGGVAGRYPERSDGCSGWLGVRDRVIVAAPVLPGPLGALAPVLNQYGYLAVGGLVLVEDFGVPSPGETVLVAAAVYAGAGQLNVVAVGVIGFVAAVMGDNIGFAIGHFGGHRLAVKFGRYVFLPPERLDRAERFFTRHGGKVVTVARFIEGLRQVNGIIAGITDMPWRRFVAFNALGAALWVGWWTSIGYLAGGHITTIYNSAHRYEVYLAIAVVVVILAVIARHLLHRRAADQHEA
jgi:membrane protein DedA with SNARE-associated domain